MREERICGRCSKNIGCVLPALTPACDAWMPNIKPCPFCGGEPDMRESSTHDFFVKCKVCGAQTRRFNENERGARNAWNARDER